MKQDSSNHQILIYYTELQSSNKTLVKLLEVLIGSSDSSEYFITDPVEIQIPIATNSNSGAVKLAAANDHLLVNYETFDRIFGFV